jgi:HSP20 family protein
MVEKSASAVQTAPSRPPLTSGTTESLMQRIHRLNEAISRRAFELFERDGGIDGRDQNHWLEAEREFLHPVHLHLQDSGSDIILRAELPGFSANDLEVNIEPRRVTITGRRESRSQREHDKTLYTETCSNEVFRTLDLPTEVNAAKATATLKDGLLDIQLPKLQVAKSVPVEASASSRSEN